MCISIIVIFAYHMDSTTLADGDYQLIPEPEGDNSEDTGNIIGDITEAPNPGSENFSIGISDTSPTNEGKPWTYTAIFITLQSIYSCISTCAFKFLGIVFETLVAYS
jgi:hypothetical protein